MELKFLSLNAWGVNTPGASDYRKERIEAIANELCKGEFDVVALQEIWDNDDGIYLEKTVGKVMPHYQRFHSQVIGSGLVTFSKYPIIDTFYHRYPLNGYPHAAYHGDWFGGKGVGMARIDMNGFRINVYNTHMCAQYTYPRDEYHGHRVCQGYELSQFVNISGELCDAVIVAGDMNTRPDSVAYALIKSLGPLQDAWLDQKKKPEESGTTSDKPTNSFVSSSWAKHFPDGERLDYIMFRNNQGCTMDCSECKLTFGKIPGRDYNYSDHEGVKAVFAMKKNPTAQPPSVDFAKREIAVEDAVGIIENAIGGIKPAFAFFLLMGILALLGVIILHIDILDVYIFTPIMRFIFTLVCAYCLAFAILGKRTHYNGYRDALGHLKRIQNSSLKKD